MYLYEYQGKELFARQGLSIPQWEVVATPTAAREAAGRLGGKVVVKAQIRAGGRGKAGLVRFAISPEEAAAAVETILGVTHKGETVQRVLIEEQLEVERELYLGVTLDYSQGHPVVLVSNQGGMDIEEVARRDPSSLVKMALNAFAPPPLYQLTEVCRQAGLHGKELLQARDMLRQLIKLFYHFDAVTIEVNPAVLCRDGRLLAADAKVIIDDAATSRNGELDCWAVVPADPCQRKAQSHNLSYISIDSGGDIGIIAGGAGLCLATMDRLIEMGGRPASFLDLGGGINADQMRAALEITLMKPGVKGIIVNVYGGINNCYTMAQGIAAFIDKVPAAKEVCLVVKMRGHSQDEGWSLLERYGLTVVKNGTTEQAVRQLLGQLAAGEGGWENGYPACG
ncbi:ATP-grasp domain-containing protein [Moorella naiadis]|uniref:ATP-grasp domain-containing protein n=1 Tax=Moorella naiadis (nom. illeg.) TaxID=3093670 RepID=UPI003D9C9B95